MVAVPLGVFVGLAAAEDRLGLEVPAGVVAVGQPEQVDGAAVHGVPDRLPADPCADRLVRLELAVVVTAADDRLPGLHQALDEREVLGDAGVPHVDALVPVRRGVMAERPRHHVQVRGVQVDAHRPAGEPDVGLVPAPDDAGPRLVEHHHPAHREREHRRAEGDRRVVVVLAVEDPPVGGRERLLHQRLVALRDLLEEHEVAVGGVATQVLERLVAGQRALGHRLDVRGDHAELARGQAVRGQGRTPHVGGWCAGGCTCPVGSPVLVFGRLFVRGHGLSSGCWVI